MSKIQEISEYSGEVGSLYVELEDGEYNVWFEDFHIAGSGPTELDALRAAAKFGEDLRKQAEDAAAKYANRVNQQ